jgi:hypothetical protein
VSNRCRRLAAKTPDFQSGERGFESRRQPHADPDQSGGIRRLRLRVRIAPRIPAFASCRALRLDKPARARRLPRRSDARSAAKAGETFHPLESWPSGKASRC